MTRLMRKILAAGFVGLLVAPAAIGTAAEAPQWPQAKSDIPADPAVKFGALPNGMRYAILKNTTPKGEVSIRLRIGAGSFEESDAQQGLAHFLEHMAFRGSTHVPAGDVFDILERLGLRTGADANASTGQTQTTFQFDLPRSDSATLDTGFMLARDIVSELSLKPEAFDAERGPVLSEERLRAGPAIRAYEAQTKFLLKGQLAPERIPIGKVDIIRNAPVSLVADFYHAYYRPERASLIIVGDIDPAAVEAEIKAKFSDWNPAGAGRGDPDLGTPRKRGKEALVFTEAGAPQLATVSWVLPYDSSPDSTARRKRNRIEGIGLAILSQRLAAAAQTTDAPFLSADTTRGNAARSAKIAALRVGYAGDKWQRALEEADKIRRQVVDQGVTQQEIDRQVATALTGAQEAVSASSTRLSRGLAGVLVNDIDRDTVFTSPAENLALTEAELKGLTADDVNAALREVFTGNGPLLFLSSPKLVEGGETALVSVFDRAESAPLEKAVAPQVAMWPYTNFGAAGRVVESRHIDDLDATFIRFENGVRLTVKPTKFRADQILVDVSIAGGDLAFPKDRKVIDPGAYLAGGLEAMTFLDMRKALTGKIASVGFGVDDDAFGLSGATRPADLDTELQLLAAYVTSPGWRPEPFQQNLRSLTDSLAKLDTTPMALFGAKFPELLHPGDARWLYPSLTDVQKARLDEVKAIIAPALANSPIEVTIVGDVTVEQATKAVSATFGALPRRSEPAFQPGEMKFPTPTPEPVVLYHSGRSDQGIAAIAWKTTDVYSDEESAARRIVTDVLQLRLMDRLRVRDGATYAPAAVANASRTFPGYGYIAAYAEIPPEKSQLFFDTVKEVTADLRDKGPTADEFERARKPELDALEKGTETNAYWAGALAGAQMDERRLKLVRDAMPGLQRVTPADVQRVARKYLSDEKAWKLVIVPKT